MVAQCSWCWAVCDAGTSQAVTSNEVRAKWRSVRKSASTREVGLSWNHDAVRKAALAVGRGHGETVSSCLFLPPQCRHQGGGTEPPGAGGARAKPCQALRRLQSWLRVTTSYVGTQNRNTQLSPESTPDQGDKQCSFYAQLRQSVRQQ